MSKSDEGSAFAGNFLEHFGVKGMKWGHRKDSDGSSVKPVAKHPASEDHNRAQAASEKAKSSGTRALSNAELRDLVNRMNLEQNFAKINTPAAKKKNPILAGTAWAAKKGGTLTGQAMEQVIKANIANEMNIRVKAQLSGKKKAASPQLKIFDYS